MLKPFYKPFEETKKHQLIALERLEKLYDELIAEFPQGIDAELSMSDIGHTCIRAFIYLEKDAPVEDTKRTISFLCRRYKKAERSFREDEGRFMWRAGREVEDQHGKYEELVLVENAHKQNCTIKKVKKTVEVYEAQCPEPVASHK